MGAGSKSKMDRYKLIVVGDGGCGKTSLLTVFTKNYFPVEHDPTVFDMTTKDVQVAGKTVHLELWDTAGQEEYDSLRALGYPDTDVILLVFSIAHPASLINAQEKWLPELENYCHKKPIILVGTKKDLRSDQKVMQHLASKGMEPIKPDVGKQVAAKIHALAYLECSAIRGEGVKEIFDTAVRLITPRKKRFCSLM
ncbi:ras-like GTP-binding protein Rho1 [Paramacrobiotus metropolitanus]|uniref:ras-like GTP-binding protein Rho1 n=1 Tax=Paramacrobiotus metropolitanus TaxID=2943436 RepID=UPI0024456F0C|nr:ras-like GTP-binding protein Rho1 [Paramacrobiotus metropolitanus]XP_055339620.1 ras-like GTP-binding protein Rho1 [Paramacrobiotus metropolitanus]